ncbi:hypothetical protein ACHAXH_008541 [Discostella pseudostelligera]
MHGKTTRALLANWSLCCIRINANLDALSASFASLRIRHEAKAVTRLAKSLLCVGISFNAREETFLEDVLCYVRGLAPLKHFKLGRRRDEESGRRRT